MNSLTNIRVSVAVAALIAGQAACRSDSTSPESRGIGVEALSPTLIVVTVGAIASPAPSIRVTNAWTHRPAPNIPVKFLATGNTGSVTNTNVVTDANGIASPGEWAFGTRPGVSYLRAFVNGSLEVSFRATVKPDVPAQLYTTQQDQAGFPGESLPGPWLVVQDRFANPISGIVVEFELTAGGGKLERGSFISDRDGAAYAGTWVLGSTPGENLATARVPGVEPLAFKAEALDSTLFTWFQLDSIRVGSRSFTLKESGIAGGRLAMTRFDACLCKKQEGFFVEQWTYSDYGGYSARSSGRYVLDGSKLFLPYLPEPGAVDGGRVLIQRLDDDFGGLWTWVYREISTIPP